MTLPPGSRLGSYEITAAIGAGGMGEVFRAKDIKLGREVAIKVLPAAFAQDPERLARFEREARLLASLNHTNIAHVYGFEAATLPDGSTAHFLAMEMVEGDDLAQRLKRGAIPIDEAIAIAKQIAEGLEEAHEKGIIHRDLKPANVKVTPDGRVKVLDFGLAKAYEGDSTPSASDSQLADSPTMSRQMTEAGVIMGTAAYMSPEQARGKPVDKRADIWSFGVVLFEMLSGKRLFAGETVSDVLAAVLTREPDWTALPPATPPPLRRLLKACFVRDPRMRLRDLGDARIALGETAEPEASTITATTAEPRGTRRSKSRAVLLSVLGGAALAATGLFLLTRRPVANDPEPTHLAVTLPPDTRLALGRGSAVALSQDGRRVVYAGVSKGKTLLYLQSLDRSSVETLPGTEGATDPFFSPDGQWVGFFADDKLKKASLGGGAPVTIANAPAPRGEFWATDGRIYLAGSNVGVVQRFPPSGGGAPEPVTSLAKGELSHRWPHLLPDARSLLYTVWNNNGWEGSRIVARVVGEAVSKEVVSSGGGYPRFIRDPDRARGYLVYARAEGLLAAAFDESRLEVSGAAVPLVDGLVTNLSGGANFDLSLSGTLAYVPGSSGENFRSLAWVSRAGTPGPVIPTRGGSRSWSLSPDGSRIARNSVEGDHDLWIDDLNTGDRQRVTSGDQNYDPVWSPDGGWLVYGNGAHARSLMRRRLTGGTAQETPLTTTRIWQVPLAISPDGRTLVYRETGATTDSDLWTVALPTGSSEGGVGAPEPFVQSAFRETDAAFSPDGKWIAYTSNESGRYEIYVKAFPRGDDRVQVSTAGGFVPAWTPDGKQLVFRSAKNFMMAVAVHLTPSPFRAERPQALFDATGYETSYSIAPDSRRFLMMPLLTTEADATQIRLILNVLAELRRKIP